jgi:hypothetical protein
MKLLTALCLLGVAACGPEARIEGNGPDAATTGTDGADAAPQDFGPCRNMDVLFVIDDSGSMGEEQNSLGAAFPAFTEVLNTFQNSTGNTLDYRVAVTTTGKTVNYTISLAVPGGAPVTFPQSEVGDDGKFRKACGIDRGWIERTDAGGASALSCRANVGTGGPAWEMPWATSMLALKERVTDGTNAGFLRDNALLAVVYITDEDDCSRMDTGFTATSANTDCKVMPTELVQYFDNLKGGRERWSAAIVAGPGPSTCESSFGKAAAATRFKEFMSMANSGGVENVVFSSICEGNMAGALQTALAKFQTACENIDVD